MPATGERWARTTCRPSPNVPCTYPAGQKGEIDADLIAC